MDSRKYLVLLLALACIAVFAAGCTSSKPATTTPAATVAKPAAPTASAVVAPSTTPECPDKNQKGVWDGNWDSRELAMAGNYDLSKAWANPDMPYGGLTVVKMTQKCWDAEGTISQKGTTCEASFTGTISKNQLTGT